jgi:hypothetical protein
MWQFEVIEVYVTPVAEALENATRSSASRTGLAI